MEKELRFNQAHTAASRSSNQSQPGTIRRARQNRAAAMAFLLLSLAASPACTSTNPALSGSLPIPPPALSPEPASRPDKTAATQPMVSCVPEVFDTGPAIKEEMLEIIDSAEDYLLINSFLLTADADSSEVMDALIAKHRDGTRIHVLADSCARYKPGGKDAFRLLEEAGIPMAEHDPIRLYKLPVAPVMLPRDHRKFWIVDGKTLFLGGANLYAGSLRSPEEKGNLDFMVSVESPEAVKEMIDSYVATWNRSSRTRLASSDFPVPQRPNAGETRLWLIDQNGNAGKRNEVEEMFHDLFDAAREEVWLIQPYTFVTPGLIRQFRELSGRGVKVNVMLSAAVEGPRFHYASHYGIKEIQEAGGTVWIYESDRCPLHAKAVLVDGSWVSIGSANLNFRSFKLSKEANLVFGDPESVGRILESIEGWKKECRRVGEEEAETYRGIDYRIAWLMMQVMG